MKTEHNIPDWNKDGVWGKVENRLHGKKKKRFLYWLPLGMACIVLLIGFFAWNVNENAANISLRNDSISIPEQSTTQKEIQNNAEMDKTIIEDHIVKQHSESNSSSTEIKIHNLENKKDDSAKQFKAIKSDNIQLAKNNIKSKSPRNTPGNQSKELFSAIADLKTQKEAELNSIPPARSIESRAVESPVPSSIDNKESAFQIFSPNQSIGLTAINFERREFDWIKDVSEAQAKNQIKKEATMFLWVENGLSFGKKSFPNLYDRTIERNSTEQFRFMHSTSIGAQRYLDKSWSISLGLTYQTIYEKYEYLSSNSKEEQILSDEAIAYYLDNEVTYFEPGLATQKKTTTRNIINNNFIHRLSIPVQVAYALDKNIFSIEPAIGVRFQYFESFNGVIAQDGNHLFDLKEINDRYYSSDIGFGLITSLSLKYNISQKDILGLKVNYEKDDFLNLKNNDLSFGAAKYETIGLRLGYYHSF